MVSLYLHVPKNKNRLMPNPFLILANDSHPHTYELILKSPTHVIDTFPINLPLKCIAFIFDQLCNTRIFKYLEHYNHRKFL